MEKGEIAHFKQFHLFPHCFPKAFLFNVLNEYIWKRGLTAEIKILLNQSWKMLLSEPLVARLITFSKTGLMKFYLKSQRMSDSFYHITVSRELD